MTDCPIMIADSHGMIEVGLGMAEGIGRSVQMIRDVVVMDSGHVVTQAGAARGHTAGPQHRGTRHVHTHGCLAGKHRRH